MATFQPGYFINYPLIMNQTTSLYETVYNEGTYDYIFVVNVAPLLPIVTTDISGVGSVSYHSTDLAGLFTNATFIQNSINPENIDINLTMCDSVNFTNWETLFNNKNIVTVLPGLSTNAFGTLMPNINQPFGERLLEVLAYKIFGHGQAQGAIRNDFEFYTHDGELWNNLTTSLKNTDIQCAIFNQYLAKGDYGVGINKDEVNVIYNLDGNNNPQMFYNFNNNHFDFSNYQNFTFPGESFDIPLFVTGHLNTEDGSNSYYANGSTISDKGSVIVNGVYNIPILISFKSIYTAL